MTITGLCKYVTVCLPQMGIGKEREQLRKRRLTLTNAVQILTRKKFRRRLFAVLRNRRAGLGIRPARRPATPTRRSLAPVFSRARRPSRAQNAFAACAELTPLRANGCGVYVRASIFVIAGANAFRPRELRPAYSVRAARSQGRPGVGVRPARRARRTLRPCGAPIVSAGLRARAVAASRA